MIGSRKRLLQAAPVALALAMLVGSAVARGGTLEDRQRAQRAGVDPAASSQTAAASAEDSLQPALVEELRKLLAEARDARGRQGAAAAAPAPADEPAAADAAAASGAPSTAAASGIAEAAPSPAATPAAARAECMYSGAKLLWERVPGSCSDR